MYHKDRSADNDYYEDYDGGDDPNWYPDDGHPNVNSDPRHAATYPRQPDNDNDAQYVFDDDYEDFDEGMTARGLNPEHVVLGRRGKLVTFFRNGDPHFKGLKTSVSQKMFTTLETLLVWLNDKISTTSGVRYIFSYPDGKEMKDVTDFIGGRAYVVSSVKKLVRMPYGDSKERFWHNKAPSAGLPGKVRRGEQNLYMKDKRRVRSYPGSRTGIRGPAALNGLVSPASRPRVLNIISNTHRDSVQKVILNPQTTQTFEDMMKDIGNMVQMEFPPVLALFTVKPPHRRVQSFSHMLRSLKNHDTFLACGREAFPLEMQQPNESPRHLDTKRDNPKPVRKPERQPERGPEPEYVQPPAQSTQAFVAPPGERDAQEKRAPPGAYSEPQPPQRRPSQLPATKVPAQEANPVPDGMYMPPLEDSRDRYSPALDDTMLAANGAMLPSDRLPPATKRPYQKALPEFDSVKVHIHGHLREFYVPRYGQIEPEGSKPDKRLKLDWVYGYRGRDSKNNLQVLPTGEMVYYVAAIGIVYDRRQDTQRHYMGHTEDITCIAMHPNRLKPLIATGQLSGKSVENSAHVRVWDPTTLATYVVLGTDVFQGGLTCLGFSDYTSDLEDGSLLMAIDEGTKHILSVWDWRNDRIVAKTTTLFYRTSSEAVVWGCFHPHDHSTIITFGLQHIFFWKLFWDYKTVTDMSGRILRDKKSGVFESPEDMPKLMTSLTFGLNGDVITGDSEGRITVWMRDHTDAYVMNLECSEPMRHAHRKSVFTVSMLEDGTLLSGGGNEIKAWDSQSHYRLVKERTIPDGCGLIRNLVPQNFGGADGNLFVGTTGNAILEGSLQEKFIPLVQGHSDELWAMASHPDDHIFVTAGYDHWVSKWDAHQHRLMWRVSVEKSCLSVTFDPMGRLVVVGTTAGRFIVLKANTGMHVASIQVANESIDAIKFSPDGTQLAMGSHDCNIYIYDIIDDGQVFRKHRSGALRGHRNFITHLDWSKDGQFLQTVSGDYDLIYWDVVDMIRVDDSKMREVEWSTQTCILGYNTLGAWSNLKEGEDINSVATNHHRDTIAVGDNLGQLRLYRYPCTSEKPDFTEQKKYTGHVTKVCYAYNDAYLLSSGGVDAAVMQWSVVDPINYL